MKQTSAVTVIGWAALLLCLAVARPADAAETRGAKASKATKAAKAALRAELKSYPHRIVCARFIGGKWDLCRINADDIADKPGRYEISLRLAKLRRKGMAGTARYNTGVLPWHHDVDGTYFWAYLWSNGDPFNDLDGGSRDWSPVARDVDGKLYGSIGWEGYREGIDDLRYIHTCIRIARQKNRKDVLADFFFKVDSTVFMDVYRARVVAMIMEMIGAK